MYNNANTLNLKEPKQQNPGPSSLVSVENQVSVEASCGTEQGTFNWKRIDSLKFAMQIALTVAILGLCIGKMTMGAQSDDKAIYWGGITGLVAWWMPSPNGTQSKGK